MRSFSRTGLYVLAAVAATVLLTSAVTVFIMRGAAGDRIVMSAEQYDRYSKLIALDEVAERIEEEYYGNVPSRDILVAGAASGMLDTLNDPYARYYSAEEYEEYLSSINGEYHGIGLLVGQPGDEGSEVLEVYEGSPGEKTGIKVGDIITHVDGASVANMPLEELSARIGAKSDEGAVLTLKRGNDIIDVTVYGDNITVSRVEYALFNQRTGYITISMFTGNCAEEFEAALDDLKDRKMTSLVIDLRNNPGGSLDIVVDVADQLLGKGMTIVSVGNDEEEREIYDARGDAIGIPVAVLVNENSASASEILAAAIQENNIGVVVGTNTYGKGVVQTTMHIQATGGWLKLTTDAYYTPDGDNIHGEGVTPDIYEELPEEYRSLAIRDIEQSDDSQLWKALEYVRSRAGKE